MSTSRRVPWYFKIPLKLVFARIPFTHSFWYRLGIFKHGKMVEFAYAQKTFSDHLKMAGLTTGAENAGKHVLELGPGESLFTAVLARTYGFEGTTLVDVGKFAFLRLEDYKKFTMWLREQGLNCPPFGEAGTIAEMLSALGAKYLVGGLKSMRTLAESSVDLLFSQAVLEHIRKNEFEAMMRECWRVLKPGGVSTHEVDYRDHLDESINHLRFAERFWEAEWVAKSGFYTNRIGPEDMLATFNRIGFRVEILQRSEWAEVPIARERLEARFRSRSDAELRTSGVLFRLRKPG